MSEDYKNKSGLIRQLAAMNPEQMTDYLTETHESLDEYAPNFAPYFYSQAINTVQYLNSKLPTTGRELAQDDVLIPSYAQQKKWLDLYDITNDPISVLEKVKNHTLTNEHVQAIKSVYPEIYEEMAKKIREELGLMRLNNNKLIYQKRVALWKFLGEPIDSTMTPESLQAIMQSNSTQPGPTQQSEQTPKKASGKALTQMNKVDQLYPTSLEARQISKQKV